MKHNLILTASLLGGIVLLAGCVKEKSNDDIYRPAGSEIVFGAATEYVNGDGTRTEYSGSDVTSGTTTYERINWISGDDMTIYYAIDGTNTQNAVYNVEGAGTADGKDSRVGITAASTKLTWGTANTSHRFRAVYPASAGFDGTNVSGSILASQTVTLNSAQSNSTQRRYLPDMSHAYMVSQLTVPQSSTTSRVDLPFTPAMTAFQFRFKVPSGQENINISSVVLSTQAVNGTTTPLTGNFSFAITGEIANVGADWTKTQAASNLSSTGTSITVSFGGNVQLKTNDYLDFTVLALPIPITGLSVQVNYADNTSKTLKLMKNNNWVQFEACKKYVITNDNVPGGESWDYYIDPIGDVTRYGHAAITATDVFTYDVKSYKVRHGTTGPKYPVAWHLEYSTNGTSWSTSFPSTGFSALTNTTGVGYDGTTSYPAESGYSTLPSASTGSTTGGAGDATRAVLASATPRGTATAPFDLSTHKVYGTGSTYEAKQADITNTTVARETANCYVISAPGVYMFPLVYGNAIKANGDNKIAYDPAHCGDTNIEALYAATNRQTLPTFRNAKNEGISGPGIVGDLTASSLSAVVVWQDAQNLILNPTVITVPGESYPFIQFEVDANYIAQGNAIVALKGSATGLSNEILWSWHIWVTEKDLTPVQINHAVSTHSMMMKYNLGWTDKTTASSTKYPDRKIYVRAVQNEKPASASTYESELFIFWQKGDATRTDDNIGSNPFYQWGRKDPMVGAASDNHYKTVYYGTGYSLPTTDYNGQTVVTPSTPSSATNGQFADAIKNPHKQYFNSGNWGWIGGPIYLNDAANHHNTSIPSNLWNSGVNHQAGGEAHHKTVYDPCPPGFCVPNSYAFMGMAGYTGAASNDWNFDVTAHSSSASDGRTFSVGSSMYFPFTGARGAVHGEIYAVKATAYYWMGSITSNSYDQGYGNTQDRYGYHNSKMMYFDSERIWPFHNLYRAACYSIRPVIE